MKFWEAVDHIRKHGGRIRRFGPSRLIAQWNHIAERLEFDHGGAFLVTGADFDLEWELVDPPKEYSFMEAFAMMEQGKWMKPVPSGWTQRIENSRIEFWEECANKNTGSGFLIWEINSKWIEVK